MALHRGRNHEDCCRIAWRTLSVKACLKPLPALSLLAAPATAVTAGAGAASTPDAVTGVVTTAAASLAFEDDAAGAGAPAFSPLAGALAEAGEGLPAAAAVEPPSSGAALWCGEATGAGEAAGDAPCRDRQGFEDRHDIAGCLLVKHLYADKCSQATFVGSAVAQPAGCPGAGNC